MIKVAPGDKVLYAKYTDTEIQIEGVAQLILEANNLLARIPDRKFPNKKTPPHVGRFFIPRQTRFRLNQYQYSPM